jgi:hypothetical protein
LVSGITPSFLSFLFSSQGQRSWRSLILTPPPLARILGESLGVHLLFKI